MKTSIVLFFAFIFSSFITPSVSAIGVDGAMTTPYLVKILVESVKQYEEIKKVYATSKEHTDMVRFLNEGISETLGLLEDLPLELRGEDVLAIRSFQGAMNEVERLYGETPQGMGEELLRLHDRSVAESIKMSQALKDYSKLQEKSARDMVRQAPSLSPKGASRMNLEAQAAILHTLNQILRVNGQMLKIQSEILAASNKKAKGSLGQFHKVVHDMNYSLKDFKPSFGVPNL